MIMINVTFLPSPTRASAISFATALVDDCTSGFCYVLCCRTKLLEIAELNCQLSLHIMYLMEILKGNALRVLWAMQLLKPVLLEGSPFIGKTSLIIALGKCSVCRVVRINFSEQTDMMDLLGSDLPVESDEDMWFSWSDGILLQALKEGCWVLLD